MEIERFTWILKGTRSSVHSRTPRLMGESMKLREELVDARRRLGQEGQEAPNLLSSLGAMAPVKLSDESA